MSKVYSKRGNYISLSSYDIDHIFGSLKYESDKEYFQSIFLFETQVLSNVPKEFSEEEVFNLQIFIPSHAKYLRFKNEFNSFDELFSYLLKNKNDKLIIPFLGIDLT